MKPNVKTTKRPLAERNMVWPLCLALTLVTALGAAAWMSKTVRGTKHLTPAAPVQPGRSAEVRNGVIPSYALGAMDKETPVQHAPVRTTAQAALPLPVTATPPLAGSLAFFDTNTGWLSQSPPGTPTPSNSAFSTSTQGLQETPSPIQGGGFLADLKGRFQNAMTITVGAGGKFSGSCSASTTVTGASDVVAPVKTASKP